MASVILTAIFLTMAFICDSASVQVKVKQGVLAGETVQTVLGNTYYSFKGIPYAKPPVGKLRFKAPQPPHSWEGVRNATQHGSICPQMQILTNTYLPGSENCLFLNVYTCNLTCNTLSPVIVVIHGGAFKFGSGDVDLYGPDFFLCDLVVVTFNYRLDVLGLISTGDCEAPGNVALKDQVAALRWVKDNIKNFGGDPDKVTIIGGTSGGASVAYHLMSPMSKGLFHRGIATSGAPTCDSVYAFEPARRAFVLGQTLGHEAKNTSDLIEFLQTVDYNKLINTTVSSGTILASEEITDIAFKMLPFTAPVIEPECPEGNFITNDPFALLESGEVNKVDVIFGYNNHEALILLPLYVQSLLGQYKRYRELFVPSKILVNSTASNIIKASDKIIDHYFGEKSISVENIIDFINYASNASIAYDMQRFFRRWPQVGNIYSYKFSCYSSRNQYGSQGANYSITGAAHFDDVFYMYDPKSLNLTLDTSSTAFKMIKQFTTSVINFAKFGNPTPDSSLGITWPLYNTSTLAYVNFAEDMTVEYAADYEDYKFWESLYKDLNLPF